MTHHVVDIALTGEDPKPTLGFKLVLRSGARVVGTMPGYPDHGPFVWDWALEIVGQGGTVDLNDLLPDTTWAAYIPSPNG